MPRFAANLSMLYHEHAFLDRFGAAARDGFEAVECLFPYEYKPLELAQRLEDHGLKQVLLNAPPGNWLAGERGVACLPGRELEFKEHFKRALAYADELSCPNIHVMAGIAPASPARAETARLQATYLSNLSWACSEAAVHGKTVLIEPINTRDMPGYFLNFQAQAHLMVQDIASSHLKVQFDIYHCQIMEGDVGNKISQYLPTGQVGHFQMAGVPERHEPHVGELNYAYLFKLIDDVSLACAWDGFVGCEYRPQAAAEQANLVNATSHGLSWLHDYRQILQA